MQRRDGGCACDGAAGHELGVQTTSRAGVVPLVESIHPRNVGGAPGLV
jgi:hypothetical protein